MACDMCGKNLAKVKANIEGVEMDVCMDCLSYGKRITTPRPIVKRQRYQKAESQITESIVGNYAQLIKQAREKRNYKQEQFAKMLNEKESLMQRIEAGKQRPNMELVKKLQKMLNITLIERIRTEEIEQTTSQPKGSLTIGDMIKKR
jgi:putative transcription factor